MDRVDATLLDRRLGAGLTAREVARVAGTTVSNVSAYENGWKHPNDTTARRLDAAISAGSSSVVHRHHLVTAPSTAKGIRRDLKAGRSTSDLVRRLREFVSNSKFAEGDADWALMSVEPSTTSDGRWDAALAATVDFCADQLVVPRPGWTANRVARPWFFVPSNEAMHAYAFANSPRPFAIKGVFIDPDDLTSI